MVIRIWPLITVNRFGIVRSVLCRVLIDQRLLGGIPVGWRHALIFVCAAINATVDLAGCLIGRLARVKTVLRATILLREPLKKPELGAKSTMRFS